MIKQRKRDETGCSHRSKPGPIKGYLTRDLILFKFLPSLVLKFSFDPWTEKYKKKSYLNVKIQEPTHFTIQLFFK